MRFLSIVAFAGLIASTAARPPNISDAHLEARATCNPGQGRESATTGKCITCPAGTFGLGESAMCQTCPSGSSSESGSSYCSCKAGYYILGGTTISVECSACPAGKSSTKGSGLCTSCPANTWSSSGGVCTGCDRGTNSGIGASECTPFTCPAGKYTSGNYCNPCGAGFYSSAGATTCTRCPVGSTSNSGSSTCTPCPGGTVPAVGYGCNQCPANTYSNGNTCTACPAGQSSPAGSTTCAGPQPSMARRAQPTLASVPLCSGTGMKHCDVLTGLGGSECINILTTLDSCGGCVGPEGEEDTTGKYTGRDCSAIPHVDEVKCVQGGCEIKSCRAGYEPSGGSCVEKAAYVGKNQTVHGSRVKRSLLGSHHDTF